MCAARPIRFLDIDEYLDEEDIVPLTCGPVSASLCLDDIYERSGL